jgi:hypothetical protein
MSIGLSYLSRESVYEDWFEKTLKSAAPSVSFREKIVDKTILSRHVHNMNMNGSYCSVPLEWDKIYHAPLLHGVKK